MLGSVFKRLCVSSIPTRAYILSNTYITQPLPCLPIAGESVSESAVFPAFPLSFELMFPPQTRPTRSNRDHSRGWCHLGAIRLRDGQSSPADAQVRHSPSHDWNWPWRGKLPRRERL